MAIKTNIKSDLQFPKLMMTQNEKGTTIVLMLDEFGKGNGIESNHPSWENRNIEDFYITSTWDIRNFIDYNEPLTIQNI